MKPHQIHWFGSGRWWCVTAALWLGGGGVGRGGESAALDPVWMLLADSQGLEAKSALAVVGATDVRERMLAETALVLARPPVAEGRLAELTATLTELARDGDEIAATALYLQARLCQVHTTPADYGRALALYQELAQRFPTSHWAQLGRVKTGFIQLYALAEPADPATRLRGVEQLLPAITEPELKRDLQLQLGWAGLFYKRPIDEVLPHLMAADRIGGLPGIIPEDLVVQIAELSMRAGHLQQARDYFERFLREYAVSLRRYNVQQRLAELVRQMEKADGA